MSVIVFSTVDFPNGDAPSAHARLLIKGLRELGESAFLLTPHASLLGNSAGNKKWHGHEGDIPFAYLSRVTTRPAGSAAATIQSAAAMWRGCIFLLCRYFRNRKDIVILYTPDALEYAPIILTCTTFRIPFIVMMVEMMTSTRDKWTWRQRLRMAGYRLTEKGVPYLASGYAVISSALYRYYSRLLPAERLLMSPILVDPGTRPSTSHPLVQRTIVHGGTFAEKDGVEHIIRAFAMISERYSDLNLILTGGSSNPATMEKLRQLVRELRIDSRVTFTGFVSREVLISILDGADVLLVCRTRSTFAEFGFPWKLGEYCMLGRPIVVTRVGDIESYFTDRESIYIADPESPSSIAACVCEILDDYDSALRVAAGSRKAAIEHFGYRTHAQRLLEFINRVRVGVAVE
jgi:glycosyltransferase involved in cell wall biosynthesis